MSWKLQFSNRDGSLEIGAARTIRKHVSRFWQDAMQILETARQGAETNVGILVDHTGGIRIVDSAGWNPDSMQAHYGARTVYQITRSPRGVRVAGKCGGESCLLEV